MAAFIDEDTQFTDETTGALINDGFIFIGADTLDPVANPITIYSNRELTSVLAQQRTGPDGRPENKIWIPGRYSLIVQDENGVQRYISLTNGEASQTGASSLTNVSGTNTITADGTPTITALVDKQIFSFIAAGTVTGAVTLQIDATAAKSVLKFHDQAIVADDWESGQAITVIVNTADDVFELISNTAAHNFPTPIILSSSAPPEVRFSDTDVSSIMQIFQNSEVFNIRADPFDVGASTIINISTDGITALSVDQNQVIVLPIGQLNFPATQNASVDANTLDDYDENVFVPTLASGAGTITLDTTLDTLAYTKIGQLVTIQGEIRVTSVSSPTGSLTLGNMPFTSVSLTETADQADTVISVDGLNAVLVNYAVIRILQATTSFGIHMSDGASTSNGVTAKVQAGTFFHLNFSYIAA